MRNSLKKNFLIFIICFFCGLALEAQAAKDAPVKQKSGFFSRYFEQARTKGESYKTKLEMKYFEERIKKTPKDITLLESYALFLRDHHYFSKAIKVNDTLFVLTKDKKYKNNVADIKILQNSLKSEAAFLDYINKAKDYESKGNIQKAAEYYSKAKEIFPQRYEAKFGLAKTHCWLKNSKLAIKDYQDLVKENPNNIDLLESYAQCLKDNGNYKSAKEIYNKLYLLKKNNKYKNLVQEIETLELAMKAMPKGANLTQYPVQNKNYSEYINQAKKFESQGKVKLANDYYLKAYNIFPDRYDARFGLAKTYGWLGQKKLASNYYKQLLKEVSNNSDLIIAYNKFLKEGIAPKPAKPKIQSQKVSPSQQSVNINAQRDKLFSQLLKTAQSYEQKGKVEEANKYYLKADAVSPSRYEVKFGLAKTYGWMHKDKLATEYYQNLLKETPNNTDLLSAYANYLKDNKKYAQAMEIYEKLFSKTNDDKYKNSMADIFFQQQDYETALKMYFEIYDKNQNSPQMQKSIALTYFISGDFENAIQFYGKYLLQKSDPESILNFGKSLFYTKKIQHAKNILVYYVNNYPDDTEGLSTLADIYVATKDVPNALALINKAVCLKPESLKLQVQRSKILMAAKEYKQAETLLCNLLSANPRDPDVLEALGDVNFFTGEFDNALGYYQSVPDNKTNKRLVYKIAQSYHYGKYYLLGQSYYRRLLCDPEYSIKSQIGLAEIEISKDKPLKARKILNKVLAVDPCNVQAKKNLGISYFSTGDPLKSIEILEKLPQDDTDVVYNLAKAYDNIERKDIALDLLRDNPQDNAKALKAQIKMDTKPALAPLYDLYYMNPANGNVNAGKYQKVGGNFYAYLRPNLRAVATGTTTQYANLNNIVYTQGNLGMLGLEGKPFNKLSFKTAAGVDAFSNNGFIILGNGTIKYTPNDFMSVTTGYIRSLDEIDSYMSAAGVVPTVGPFANQLVGRIIDNKYLTSFAFKLPHKMYAYAGFNVGNKYGSNSPSNFYKELPAGLGKVMYSAPEDRPINQVLLGYDFYYTGYNRDQSGFGGANLSYSPIGSDGGSPTSFDGNPGVGGYFSPTLFVANKFPVTVKGSFKQTKLKYVLSAFVGSQSIQGQVGLLGTTPLGNGMRNIAYYGWLIGLRYNEKGRVGWGLDYTYNNYMAVAQHLLRLYAVIRF